MFLLYCYSTRELSTLYLISQVKMVRASHKRFNFFFFLLLIETKEEKKQPTPSFRIRIDLTALRFRRPPGAMHKQPHSLLFLFSAALRDE